MSTTANLRTTSSRRRALLTAGVLAALVTAAGAGAAPANALLPDGGNQINAMLTSATFQIAEVVDSLEALQVPAAHIDQITKEAATGEIDG